MGVKNMTIKPSIQNINKKMMKTMNCQHWKLIAWTWRPSMKTIEFLKKDENNKMSLLKAKNMNTKTMELWKGLKLRANNIKGKKH